MSEADELPEILTSGVQLHYKIQGLISRGLIRLQQIDEQFMEALASREVLVISAALSMLGSAQIWIEKPAEVWRRQAEQLMLEREVVSR